MADSGLTVGIQHPGLPTDMVMSCGQDEFYVHVLDANASCLLFSQFCQIFPLLDPFGPP